MPFSQKASTHSTTYRHLIRAASIGLVAIGASLIPVLPAGASPAPAGTHAPGGFGNGGGGNRGRYGNAGGQGGASGYGNGRSSHADGNGGDPDVKPRGYKAKHTLGPDGLGIKPGKIKHVWLIIMENKSYDATFSGLNNNTYLWKTLPSQGVLLTQYYGTGHFSNDNYLSLVSGQAPVTDTQSDCPYYDAMSGTVDMSGNLTNNPNYGQFTSGAGPNAAAGQNGCVYPATVPTLFNQLDAAGVSWKGYAQDLNDTNTLTGTSSTLPSNSAGTQYCGAPYATPAPTGDTSQPNPGSANPTDQYVPKHFPFPWFESVLQSGDCSPAHIANLFDPANGLYHDLQSQATTPAFSWISPNNCSDAHDAVCAGNNLSGGWSGPTTPNAPVNYTGGLYAGDLFLEHVVPEDRGVPGVQRRWSHRHNLRRGLRSIHLYGQQFPERHRRAAGRRHLHRERHRRRDAVRQVGQLGAPGPEHAAGHRSRRPGAVPRRWRQRLHRPSLQLRGADSAAPARGYLPPRRGGGLRQRQ